MAHVAAKGKVKYDEAREWPRIEQLLAAQPTPANYSYTGLMQAAHDEYVVELSGMFHWHPSGNNKTAQAFHDFVYNNSRINITSWTQTPVSGGRSGNIITFNMVLKPTTTFTSYQLTNIVLDVMRLWFKVII